MEYETWPVHPAIRNAPSSVDVYAFVFVNYRLHHDRQKFCNFIQIISHTLKLFMRSGVTLLFHTAKHLQETSNINIETDYKTKWRQRPKWDHCNFVPSHVTDIWLRKVLILCVSLGARLAQSLSSTAITGCYTATIEIVFQVCCWFVAVAECLLKKLSEPK